VEPELVACKFVWMVIVELVEPLAGGVTGFGEAEQEESPGQPENTNVTGELKEFSDVTVASKAMLWPAASAADVGFNVTANAVTGAVPVPLSGTLCGEVGSLSVMLRLADSAACVEGVKVTLIVQAEPAANVEPELGQVLVCEKSAAFVPVVAMLLMVSAAVPVFVSVTGCEGLAVPCD